MLHCIVGFVSHIASTTLVWFLALLRLSPTLPYPVHVPVPILCSSKGLHPCSHSRPRSRPRCHLVVLHRLHPVLVPAPSPLPLTSPSLAPFARSRPSDPPSVCRDDVCVYVCSLNQTIGPQPYSVLIVYAVASTNPVCWKGKYQKNIYKIKALNPKE